MNSSCVLLKIFRSDEFSCFRHWDTLRIDLEYILYGFFGDCYKKQKPSFRIPVFMWALWKGKPEWDRALKNLPVKDFSEGARLQGRIRIFSNSLFSNIISSKYLPAMEKGGSTYILTNKNHSTLYTGATSDLESRVLEYRLKEYPTSFSAKYNVVVLVYYQTFDSIEEAIEREKYIKGKSRKWKMNLIYRFNPTWRDLYEDFTKD